MSSLTSLQALHRTLATSIGRPDLFAHLLYDGQQVRVGALRALGTRRLHRLSKEDREVTSDPEGTSCPHP